MTYTPINFADKLARFSDHWAPKIIAHLRAGEMFVAPRGVEHKPYARDECRMMLVEPAGTANTGGVRSELTAKDGVWV